MKKILFGTARQGKPCFYPMYDKFNNTITGTQFLPSQSWSQDQDSAPGLYLSLPNLEAK